MAVQPQRGKSSFLSLMNDGKAFCYSVFKRILKELSVLLINNRDSGQGPEEALFTRALSLVSDSMHGTVLSNVHMLGGDRTEPERKKREKGRGGESVGLSR